MGRERVRVSVFGLEVFDDLGVGALVEPVVIVDARLPVHGQLLADLLGQGRLGDVLGENRNRQHGDE